ncbi:MAG: LPS biosynthesis protein [Alphaproteobacteria bacterium]|nr:LPS biosynthesis protein [Alphaproteobacteria bacterium]
MIYCKKCLEPNTRPNSKFDKNGVCLPCSMNSVISEKILKQRSKELEKICKWAKKNALAKYDCIIPVSGGKDSTRQALHMRDNLNMNPLLVTCAYPPEQQTERGARNMANLISLGFDAYYISPSPKTWKKLMKHCFFKYGNIFKSCELALFASAPKLCLSLKIPLMVYGENAALQWGGDTHVSKDGDGIKQKYTNTLEGGDITKYLKEGFKKEKFYWYDYPSDKDLIKSKVKIIYLGYYLSNFDDETNSKISQQNGLEFRTGEDASPALTGSLTPYDALDDDFVFVNQMLKYFKFGFGKVTQQLSGFIRKKKYLRDEAIEIAQKFDGKCSEFYINKFCRYIGISNKQFWQHADKLRNKKIWKKTKKGWILKYSL